MTESPVEAAIARAYREEWARLVAGLARRFGDLDVAEEAAAEAYVAAVERWPRDGVPPDPGGWLTTTAARRAIDRLRRESPREAKHQVAQMLHDDTVPEPTGPIEDDRLRLVFTCCHPALTIETRVALTLRLLDGLTVAEIARAFLVFNEGYLASECDDPLRPDLTDEAIRLGRLLRMLLPDDGEVTDLLRRVGRSSESRAAYDTAIRLADNPAERAYLTRRRDQIVN